MFKPKTLSRSRDLLVLNCSKLNINITNNKRYIYSYNVKYSTNIFKPLDVV